MTVLRIMYLGKIVEIGPSEEVTERPRHPYTQALLSALPIADPDLEARRQRVVLRGEPPSPVGPPPGCRFAGRCPIATSRCATEEPLLQSAFSDGAAHQVACQLPMSVRRSPSATAISGEAPTPAPATSGQLRKSAREEPVRKGGGACRLLKGFRGAACRTIVNYRVA